jgi:pimeloyl-ACP methyl ester carboxylesterase
MPDRGVPLYLEGIVHRLQVMLDAGEREKVVLTFMMEIVGMPPHELERFKSLPAFPARVAAAHTLPRELHATEEYQFERERLEELRVPTLLLLGGDSPELFKTAIEAWHAVLPSSQIVVLPGQRHIAIDTAPDLFVREVQAFLLN